MKKFLTYTLVITLISLLFMDGSKAFVNLVEMDADGGDSTKNKPQKDTTLKYKITDRPSVKTGEIKPKEFDLNDPKNLVTTIEYDSNGKMIEVREKVGLTNYRHPTYMTLKEYLDYQGKIDESAYWRKRSSSFGVITKKGNAAPGIDLGNEIFDRAFGNTGIEVKPTGNLNMSLGGNWQRVDNPNLPINQRRWGIFDFDIQPNLNMMAKVGDKMKFNFNFNSRATFNFENRTKLEYAGQEDNIIRKIEAGNVGFTTKSKLISGVQGIFGGRAQLQFGRLMVNTVIGQQNSKKESITLQGGAQSQEFSITSDNYDINRHFFLNQFFRSIYNTACSELPLIKSQVNITKVEVWITNRTGVTNDVRDVVALADLGETNPYLSRYAKAGEPLPGNNANSLYATLNNNPSVRNIGTCISVLNANGLQATQDFEKVFARKLQPSDFTYHPKLGYINLNISVNPDDVVGVAYQYTYNGRTYQVGEFAQDLPPDSLTPKVLLVKMLKATTFNPTIPLWDLMMKNVYSLGGGNISKDDFQLNVFYKDAAGAEKRYMPEGPFAGQPLIRVMNLDRLNNQTDPQPDGIFDFIEGTTIYANQGKIVFPVLEPFGKDLEFAFNTPQLQKKYLYYQIYDSTQFVAQQYPQLNRFLLKGNYKGSGGSRIFLGGFNIPQGSVVVTAGGTQLVENTDYTIDYNTGALNILNTGILNSGVPINVSYENNANFGFQMQNFTGVRLDYFVNNKLNLGSTIERLTERPFTNKVQYGEDPIKNTALGLDLNYQSESKLLTRLVDKLPVFSTTAPSIINAGGEVATMIPGHSRLIGQEGNVYIDDFEGSRSGFDLKFPVSAWSISSPPVGSRNQFNVPLFPEASQTGNLKSGVNRALLNWYNLDPSMNSRMPNTPEHLKKDIDQLSDHYIRAINQSEVFPQRQATNFNTLLTTFDLAFYPKERGPYNFDATNLDANGGLLNPRNRWGGVTRYIDQSDFENSNVQFIEFWMMDPFLYNKNSTGGELHFNLGLISEDILKDSRKSFENGIPYPFDSLKMEQTAWGQVPRTQQQINNAFDNNNQSRSRQDVGYDGLDNIEEAIKFNSYLTSIGNTFGTSSSIYQKALSDPANDDFAYFQSTIFDSLQTPVHERYKKFNHPHGNSPVNNNVNSNQFSFSFTNVPDAEDINRDNTLNENEAYFEYIVPLRPNMQEGENFIVSKVSDSVMLPNKKWDLVTWYQFKIPIREYQNRVGAIQDFRSIRFIRMFMTGFEDSIYLRFARLELSRSQWRKYNFSLKNPGEYIPEIDHTNTDFVLSNVSLEENSSRQPVPYMIPPGIIRQQQQVNNGQIIPQNEQSIAMQICRLEDGDSRGAFKQIDMDIRQFNRLKFFVHAESPPDRRTQLNNNDVNGFIRLGNDFNTNFYEYQIPLQVTLPNASTPLQIWPEANQFDIVLKDFVELKKERDLASHPINVIYTKVLPNGHVMRIIGNPNLGDVKMAMLGITNPKKPNGASADDGLSKCGEFWFNELRMTNMNQSPGYAATAFADVQLADLATVRLAGNMHTLGYGGVEQKLNARFRDNYTQYSASTNIQAGKLFPKEWGVQLPLFIGQSKNISSPQFDPYNMDVPLKEKIASLPAEKRDSFRNVANTTMTVNSINVQNVRINPSTNEGNATTGKTPWSLQNFDMSYSYNKTMKASPLLVFDDNTDQLGELGYNYAPNVKAFEPFKKKVKSKNKKVDKYLTIIRDFNVKPLPTNITVRNIIHRYYSQTQVRNIEDLNYQLPTTYFKYFTWNRQYSMRWNLANSLNIEYTANNNSRIDEPDGAINTASKRDTVLRNFARFGRNTLFTQNFNVNYTIPINKLPIFDWVSMRASYQSSYNWTAASRFTYNLGNTVGNTQVRTLNGDFNFANLYNKSSLLRKANQPKPTQRPNLKPSSKGNTDGKDDEDSKGKDKTKSDRSERNSKSDDRSYKDKKSNNSGGNSSPNNKEVTNPDKKSSPNASNVTKVVPKPQDIQKLNLPPGMDTLKGKAYTDKLREYEKKMRIEAKKKRRLERIAARRARPLPDATRIGLQLLTGVKRANFSYTENMSSTLPGFMDSTLILGTNWRSSPQLAYALGMQPSRDYLESLGGLALLSRDSLFNTNFTQQHSANLNATATVEPIRGMNINLNLTRNVSKTYTELFKDTTGKAGLQHLNPLETGTLSMTFISFKTMFMKEVGDTKLTQAFYDFENNRKIISKRLGMINPYIGGTPDPNDPEYKKGYNRYAQEVLIPAMLSAYTGKDPNTYPLQVNDPYNVKNNPFKYIKSLPNWRLSYNGLSKAPLLRDHFSNVNVTHAYSNTLNMNNFASSLFYQDAFGVGFPSFIDSVSGNLIPYFFVPNITITEAFSPLIGLDLASKGGTTIHFEYKRTRSLLMNLLDFQLNQTTTKEIIFGAGARFKKATLPLPIFDMNKKKTDINVKLDVSVRDNKSDIMYLDRRDVFTPRGDYQLGVHPSMDYIYSKYLTLRFYYDLTRNIPYTSNAYPIKNTKAGIMFRFILGN